MHALMDAVQSGGYLALIVLMALQNACVPLPSEVVLPFAGYLVFRGQMGFHAAVWAGTLGCVLGSWAAYAIGSFGGRPLIEKYGRYVLLRSRDLDAADRFFAKYGDAAALFSRLIPIVRTFISLPAGMARMNLPRFLAYTFLGSLPWCYLLTYAGMAMGRRWDTVGTLFHGADRAIAVLLVAAVALYIGWHLKPDHRG